MLFMGVLLFSIDDGSDVWVITEFITCSNIITKTKKPRIQAGFSWSPKVIVLKGSQKNKWWKKETDGLYIHPKCSSRQEAAVSCLAGAAGRKQLLLGPGTSCQIHHFFCLDHARKKVTGSRWQDAAVGLWILKFGSLKIWASETANLNFSDQFRALKMISHESLKW